MKFAKIVGYSLALIGAAVLGYTLFLLGAVCLDFISHGLPRGWNGWPDALFFLLMLAGFAAVGGVVLRWGWAMARAGTADAEQGAANLVAFAVLFTVIMGVIWAMRSSLDRLRWTCAGFLALLWLVIAVSNASIAWREFVRKEKGPSMTMLIGGIIGLAAVNAIPNQWDEIKWPLRFAAVLLDFGSAPMLVIGVGMMCLGLARSSK